MGSRSASLLHAPLLIVLLLATSIVPVCAGDPVPGIDISLEQIPGAIKHATTDATGGFVFESVAPGAYLLRLGPISAAKVENHNSSRSNKTYPISLPGGGEELGVRFAVSSNVVQGKDPGMAIDLGGTGPGRITGTVNRASTLGQQQKDEVTKALAKGGAKGEAVSGILDALEDLARAAENHHASQSNVKPGMAKAGVPEASINELLSMVEVAVKEEGVKGRAAKGAGASNTAEIRKRLSGLRVKEEDIRRILVALEGVAQCCVDYNSSRSNVKLVMKAAGVADPAADQILSEMKLSVRGSMTPGK